MTIYFTADTHFGHQKILDFCRDSRPGDTIEEHDEALVARWNASIGPRDTVYHLGDFAWRNPGAYFNRLNGRKILIAGNHDHRETRALPWAEMHQAARIKIDGLRLFLCHYPVVGFREDLHLHGHTHGTRKADDASIDVGVDTWGAPVCFDVLRCHAGKTEAAA